MLIQTACPCVHLVCVSYLHVGHVYLHCFLLLLGTLVCLLVFHECSHVNAVGLHVCVCVCVYLNVYGVNLISSQHSQVVTNRDAVCVSLFVSSILQL